MWRLTLINYKVMWLYICRKIKGVSRDVTHICNYNLFIWELKDSLHSKWESSTRGCLIFLCSLHCFLVTLHVEEDIQREREREELRGKRREAKVNERCPRIEFVSKGCLECLRETKKNTHTLTHRESCLRTNEEKQ